MAFYINLWLGNFVQTKSFNEMTMSLQMRDFVKT